MNNYLILIADDYQENIQIIADILNSTNINHKIIRALNGKILCELAEKRIPDLIITDWEMPEMNGIEAIEYLKSKEATKEIPIIMCTGVMISSINLKMALDSGAVDFIRKPVDSIELQARVYSMLKLSESYRTIKNQKNILEEQNKKILIQNEELENHRNNLEELVKQRTLELEIAKNKAEESNRLKSTFMDNMSHEVRTPLNAIVGFSELMSMPNQTAENLKSFSEIISSSSEKLIEIITNVIEISQIHSNTITPKLTEFEIISFLNTIIDKYKIKAIQKKLDLFYEIDIPFNEFLISSDFNKLQRIIFYLLDNALKFTLTGKIEFICKLENNNINFSISDTGIGIPKEMQDVIFEPFRQVESGATRSFEGNGLGLSLAKAFIELLNGSITLHSELKVGSIFIFSIPTNKIIMTNCENTL